MTEEEAATVARRAVEERGGTLTPRIKASKGKRWIWFGRSYWYIVSNLPRIGGNWWLTIDDETGEVRSIGFSKK
jgi:hypothetical protein